MTTTRRQHEHALRYGRYCEWLASRTIGYNFDVEVPLLALRVHKTVVNDTPPLELWLHIIPTLRLLEKVREEFGPTTINSAYRSDAYNGTWSKEGSVENSTHEQNSACDFFCKTGSPAEWHAFLKDLREKGEFKGGLGLYRTFVHVDTRGRNADWKGA